MGLGVLGDGGGDDCAVTHVEDAVGDGGGFGVVVIMRTVWLSSRPDWRSMARTASEFLVSRLPVGSSARTMAGWVMRARGDGDALLLAAGELVGAVPEAAVEAEDAGEVIEQGVVEGLAGFGDVVGDLDVAHGGEGGEEVEALEDEADASAAEAGAIGVGELGELGAAMVTEPVVAWVRPPRI